MCVRERETDRQKDWQRQKRIRKYREIFIEWERDRNRDIEGDTERERERERDR